ncbi:MAG: hypothetical protein U9R79_03260 [Armatimonadota bacterium]|nr:hypothetical protein [Armatimonadota bacterium]
MRARKLSLCATVLLLLLAAQAAFGQCRLDLPEGILASRRIELRLPQVGEGCNVALVRSGTVISPRHWYYCGSGDMQRGRRAFRSNGEVLAVDALQSGPEEAAVRITCLTDLAEEPDVGTFTMTYRLQRGSPAVLHEMTFTPKAPLALRGYEFFVATEEASARTHRLHHYRDPGALSAMPAETNAAYARIPLAQDPPFAALESLQTGVLLAVGVPPADVTNFMYCIDFTRFEVSRSGGYVTPVQPLRDFALIGAGEDLQELAGLYSEMLASVERPARNAEPPLPTPDLRAAPPPHVFDVGARAQEARAAVAVGDLRATVDPRTGALRQLETPAGPMLSAPGGIEIMQWPDRELIGPEGAVSGMRADQNALSWRWSAGRLTARHALVAEGRDLGWTMELRNEADQQRLLEVRLALPLALGGGDAWLWDGMRLIALAQGEAHHENTTLVPGGIQSQGIFPAVCAHSAEAGVALGMQPMHIESFYGSRLQRTDGGDPTLSYVVRWALPAGERRTARFVLYAIDPRWSWRSCVQRYWEAWPEVFAAPERDDVWGLYSASSPAFVHNQGDIFIERCRRLRVGAMELYAPFAKTGDFYPDEEPVYLKGELRTREEMRAVQETANIASCNISYVIPTKCEREMARSTYADSVIRLADGSMFMLDRWDVMGGGREKLAGMFAWGDSFGESLRQDVRQIVESYRPDGFYFDNGAFVWQDYGRESPWMAFDDEGRVYTNAGIPYAKLQDDLQQFAPHIHRNPGEFIQYFSGFRGHSHLTNIVGSQQHYVRSHRLIMGYKPIYLGHPNRIGSRDALYDFLELGGLPWLVGTRASGERLAQAWAPIAIALARAGWRPITNAVADGLDVRVERFGQADGTMLTVRNLSSSPIRAAVTVLGELPGLGDFLQRKNLEPVVADGRTTVRVALEGREMAFLAATPPDPPRDDWPPASFLADAEPVSIVIPAQPSDAERRMARRVRGFVQLQAQLLEREPTVEIVEGGEAAYPARFVIQEREGPARLQAPDAGTLELHFADETEGASLLSDFLDTIAEPMSKEPARWLP